MYRCTFIYRRMDHWEEANDLSSAELELVGLCAALRGGKERDDKSVV